MVKKKKARSILKYIFFALYTAALLTGIVLWRGMIPPHAYNFGIDLKNVLFDFDNSPEEESFEIEGRKVFPARSEQRVALEGTDQIITVNTLSGFAFLILDSRDSEGINPLLVGLDMEGQVSGARYSLHRRALLPENKILPEALKSAQEFFINNRALLIEKASEGAVS